MSLEQVKQWANSGAGGHVSLCRSLREAPPVCSSVGVLKLESFLFQLTEYATWFTLPSPEANAARLGGPWRRRQVCSLQRSTRAGEGLVPAGRRREIVPCYAFSLVFFVTRVLCHVTVASVQSQIALPVGTPGPLVRDSCCGRAGRIRYHLSGQGHQSRPSGRYQGVPAGTNLAVRSAVRAPCTRCRKGDRLGLRLGAGALCARGAHTWRKFKHPNIVTVFSVFEANGTAYMVMEYERGVNLEQAIEAGLVAR